MLQHKRTLHSLQHSLLLFQTLISDHSGLNGARIPPTETPNTQGCCNFPFTATFLSNFYSLGDLFFDHIWLSCMDAIYFVSDAFCFQQWSSQMSERCSYSGPSPKGNKTFVKHIDLNNCVGDPFQRGKISSLISPPDVPVNKPRRKVSTHTAMVDFSCKLMYL